MTEQPIVHVGTQVVVTFGRLDADGDVIDPKPCRFTLLKLDDQAFEALRQAIFSARVQLEAELAGKPPWVEDPGVEAESAEV